MRRMILAVAAAAMLAVAVPAVASASLSGYTAGWGNGLSASPSSTTTSSVDAFCWTPAVWGSLGSGRYGYIAWWSGGGGSAPADQARYFSYYGFGFPLSSGIPVTVTDREIDFAHDSCDGDYRFTVGTTKYRILIRFSVVHWPSSYTTPTGSTYYRRTFRYDSANGWVYIHPEWNVG